MHEDALWSGTPSGARAYRAKLRMDDAIQRWRDEAHPRRRFEILLEYTTLMHAWLHHIQEHLRELDAMKSASLTSKARSRPTGTA